MIYRVRDDVTREQLVALVEALNPFYGIGSVLDVAQFEGGHAITKLYNGQPKPAPADDDDCEQQHDDLQRDACLFGAVGLMDGAPASFMAPVLQAKHFLAARDAFLACIEDKPKDQG